MRVGLITVLSHVAQLRRVNTRLLLALAPLLVLVLVACGEDAPSTAPATTSISPLSSPTVEANIALTSTMPTPIGELPEPEPGAGHVLGRVTTLPDEEPIAAATLFLGELLPGDDDSIAGVGLEPDRAPHAETDAEGNFVFLNVPPGEYGLIWWQSHRESYALSAREQDEGQFLTVTVREDDITDLGDVTVDRP